MRLISTVAPDDETADQDEDGDEDKIAPHVFEDKELLIEKNETNEDGTEDEGVELEEDMDVQQEDAQQDEDIGTDYGPLHSTDILKWSSACHFFLSVITLVLQ